MGPISVLIKPSSGMCNMSCEYCFYFDEMNKRKQDSYGFMSEQTLKNIIRRTMLKAEGSVTYAFQGGEPTLRGLEFFEKAVEYQKQYQKKNIRVNNVFQTNGYLLDDKWCSFFHENHFLIGISIDGISQTHDRYRHTKTGEATFEKIKHATKLMDQYSVDYNIVTVVNQEVASQIKEIYTYYQEQDWNYQQYIACMEPLGEKHGKKSYAIKPEEYGKFMIDLFNMWYSDLQKGKQPYIRQFENYLGVLLGYNPEACDQLGICGIQNVVEADGSVYPCDFYMLDEYRLGNFNANQIEEINEKRKEIGFVERSKNLSKECKMCRFYKICRGGCQRNRDYNKQKDTYENYFCLSYQMFFEECLPKMYQIIEQRKFSH